MATELGVFSQVKSSPVSTLALIFQVQKQTATRLTLSCVCYYVTFNQINHSQADMTVGGDATCNLHHEMNSQET